MSLKHDFISYYAVPVSLYDFPVSKVYCRFILKNFKDFFLLQDVYYLEQDCKLCVKSIYCQHILSLHFLY